MSEARDFDVAAIRLTAARVHEWQGLVFAALDDDAPPFETVYGGIAGRIAPVDLSAMAFHSRVEYEVQCNWKVYIDNFLEGYHLPHVHPGLSKVLDYRSYDTELFDWYSLQHSPLRDADDIYGGGDAWYYFVYPNIMLNIMPARLQTNVVLPLALDRCKVVFDYYFSGDGAARSGSDLEFSDEIQQEDIDICQQVQRGLLSGGYVPGRLSPKREAGVWHFQNLLRRAYAESER
jgi:choline monooxygenase